MMVVVLSKKLHQIANIVDGEVSCSNTDDDLEIDSIAPSPENSTISDLVLVYDQKYIKNIQKIKAKAFILPLSIKDKIPTLSQPIIWVKRPRLTLKKLLDLFKKPVFYSSAGIHPTAVIEVQCKIAKSARVGANVFIGPNCVVGENTIINPNVYIGSSVVIGNNCIIYSNCSILDATCIGNNVILHSGVVIGSDGYSYVTEEESNLEKVKHRNFDFNSGRQVQHKIHSIGNVIIEDDVEIGANSCIDAATIGSTIIGTGTKIDNLVQVAHNCKIGKDCLIVGQVGFAGSVNTGDRVVVGGQCGLADNINVGDDVVLLARAGVHGDIPSNSVYLGIPAVPYQEYFKNEKALKRMPRKISKLEEYIKELENKIKLLEEELSVGV